MKKYFRAIPPKHYTKNQLGAIKMQNRKTTTFGFIMQSYDALFYPMSGRPAMFIHCMKNLNLTRELAYKFAATTNASSVLNDYCNRRMIKPLLP